MVDFALTEEQLNLREMAHAFAERGTRPVTWDYDRDGTLIQFMIADMATGLEAARLLTWKSATLLDQGERNTLASSHAERFAADTAMKVATAAVQVHGGYGVIQEYPVATLMRDAKIMQLYEGTPQIQRLVIARDTLLPHRIAQPAAAA